MTKKRPTPKRRTKPEDLIDVTRIEYSELLALAKRNEAMLARLETAFGVQFRRIAEIQAEVDQLRKPKPTP